MRKLAPSLIGVCLTAGAFASDGFAGTKTGSGATAPSSGGPGIPAMLQMLFAVGIVVFLLKAVLPKLASKVNKKLVTGAASTLKIEESANFAGGSLYVVRARRKTLLLAVSGTAVNCLADLTEAEDAEPLPPTFGEILNSELGTRNSELNAPVPATVVEAEIRNPKPEVPDTSDLRTPNSELEQALQRLQRLGA